MWADLFAAKSFEAAYAFDLRQVCGGYAYFSTFTSGQKNSSTGYEIRRPSQVHTDRYCLALKEIGVQPAFIDSELCYRSWLCVQGWAIINANFARHSMQQWLKQHDCIKSSLGSFTDISIASPNALKRSLRGRAKREIHDRDGNRCLLCESDESLTLQHVWPYSAGGETTSRNLVTLCESCNQQLSNEILIDLYQIAKLPSGLEPSLLRGSNLDEAAQRRASYFSGNLMHTRCEVW